MNLRDFIIRTIKIIALTASASLSELTLIFMQRNRTSDAGIRYSLSFLLSESIQKANVPGTYRLSTVANTSTFPMLPNISDENFIPWS